MTNTHKTKYKSVWNIKSRMHFNSVATNPKTVTVRVTNPAWEDEEKTRSKEKMLRMPPSEFWRN